MDKKTQSASKYAVPALDKGLDILEYIVTQEQPKSQTEIATALSRSANEIYRVLVGLEARGYLIRDELSGKYSASLKIYNLSRRISPLHKVAKCALPHMEDFAFSTGHSCHLSMLYQSQAMVILHARSHGPVSISIAEGTLFPASETVSGRILLANSNPDVQGMILERDDKFNQMNKEEKAEFLALIDSVRVTGIDSAQNELSEGINNFAVLIGKPNGLVVASLTVSTLNSNGDAPSQALITHAQTIANKISEQLQC
ncbi:IclR family transcriptional regulator [Psychromonas sp. MME2]|uniref:IclR family transcriptional regulator n=1 Tax=unclassified Psychromonas TaxID=2614957 RepID=UPI00339D2C6E